jgi:hypothetical protein
MNFLGSNRLIIVEYNYNLKAKIDAIVETCIAANHEDEEREARVNQARAEWFKAIDEFEKYNLAELDQREDKHLKLEREVLFKKVIFGLRLEEAEELVDFCFTTTDALSFGVVECFRVSMKIANKDIVGSDLPKYGVEKLFLNMDTSECIVNMAYLITIN